MDASQLMFDVASLICICYNDTREFSSLLSEGPYKRDPIAFLELKELRHSLRILKRLA